MCNEYSGNRTHGIPLTKLRAVHGGRSEVSANCKSIKLTSTWLRGASLTLGTFWTATITDRPRNELHEIKLRAEKYNAKLNKVPTTCNNNTVPKY